ASQVQTALNGLTTVGSVGGTVTVSQTTTTSPAGSIYTIIFGGTLGNAHQPLLTIVTTGTTAGKVDLVRDGGTGALHNIANDNAWTGPVVLQSADSVGVEALTHLTISGVIEDPLKAPVPAATFTKVGAGTLILPTTNAYTGLTQVNAGILSVQSSSTP